VAMFQLRDGGEGRRQQGRRGGRAAASASPAVASADFYWNCEGPVCFRLSGARFSKKQDSVIS